MGIFSAAILLIMIISLGSAFLIARESKSERSNKNFGKIIGAALVAILVIVVYVGYQVITYLK